MPNLNNSLMNLNTLKTWGYQCLHIYLNSSSEEEVWYYLHSNLFFISLIHRCGSTNCLYHLGLFILSTTLWDPPDWISLCPSSDNLALLHKCYWTIQYLPLESSCLSSAFSLLHVQIPKEDSERRLDVLGWHFVMHNR